MSFQKTDTLRVKRLELLIFLLVLLGCDLSGQLAGKATKRTGLDDVNGSKRGGEVVGYDPGQDFSRQTYPLTFTSNGTITGDSVEIMFSKSNGQTVAVERIELTDFQGNVITHSVNTPPPSIVSPQQPLRIQVQFDSIKQISKISMVFDLDSVGYQNQPENFVVTGNQSGSYSMSHNNYQRDNFIVNKAPTVFVPEQQTCTKEFERVDNLGECSASKTWCSDISGELKNAEATSPCVVKKDGATIDCRSATSLKHCVSLIFGSTSNFDFCKKYDSFLEPGFTSFFNIDYEKRSYYPTECATQLPNTDTVPDQMSLPPSAD